MTVQLYEKVSEGLRCTLCPHLCFLSESQFGKCRVRLNTENEVRHVDYGSVSTLVVEPLSKKPFKHFLPESKTLTLSSWSCNLDCSFCENNEISQSGVPKDSVHMSPEALVRIAKEKGCESISMSFNEPILSYEFLMDIAQACAENDLKFVLKTGAFINKEPWAEICNITSAINVDWKGDKKAFAQITGTKEQTFFIEDRVREAYNSGTHLEISVPLYYAYDEIENQMETLGILVNSIDADIPCHLLNITPAYNFHQISNPKSMPMAKEVLSRFVDNVYTCH